MPQNNKQNTHTHKDKLRTQGTYLDRTVATLN